MSGVLASSATLRLESQNVARLFVLNDALSRWIVTIYHLRVRRATRSSSPDRGVRA